VTVVRLRHLGKAYGRVVALDDVSFDVEEGVTGLLGPNGAGKSTLLLCVLGLLDGWTGDVSVLDLDARRKRLAIRRRVGFLPETDAWLPRMTAIRAVRFLGRLGGLPWAQALRRAHEVLWHVGLGEAIYRDLREYSTGMRQRFKLAQALVHDPDVIFLDEPLGGMDPRGRDELLELVRDLSTHHGKHVVWSSHILPEVQKVADRVVVLHHGRFGGALGLDDLAQADGRWRLEIEGNGEGFREGVRARGGRVEEAPEAAALALLGRHALLVTLPPDTPAALLWREARRHGVRIRRLERPREDLEHAFHRLLQTGEASS